jgi:glucose dehydrogenase
MQLLAATTFVAALTMLGGTQATANDELIKLEHTNGQWAIPAGNYASQRYSDLKQINVSTAKNLHPVWTFSTGVLRGHEGGPLVIGDVMYLSTPFPNKVFALDLNNGGRILWSYSPVQNSSVIPVMCCDTVNRGVAYGEGKIFLHQADTTLVALDAQTGKPIWSVKDDDPAKGATGTSAPLVVKDKVLVGVSGGLACLLRGPG